VRSGKLDEITAAESRYKVVRVSWVGTADARSILAALPNVSNVTVQDSEAVFRFTGSDEQLAQIPGELTARGVRVLSFSEVKQTVEELYLKLSTNEVM
ncbi:MAG TPA: DUF4162 domain-containing protein, partial [Terriglobales bacterium]|nr:DUF4162 domain-containing protein [Terriglobales bacterium]